MRTIQNTGARIELRSSPACSSLASNSYRTTIAALLCMSSTGCVFSDSSKPHGLSPPASLPTRENSSPKCSAHSSPGHLHCLAIPAAWLRGVHRLRDVLTPLVDTLPADFITLGQAHKALQRIGLLIQYSQRIGCGACSHHSHCVLLRHWQANMVPLTATLTTPKAKSTAAILQLHAMALGIMSDALVNGDAAFEEATPTFETIAAHTALLLESEDQTQRPSHEINLSFEAGLIGPLYYTAIKRRVLPVRLRALRLLEVAPWREGIWRSGIAASQAGSSRLR